MGKPENGMDAARRRLVRTPYVRLMVSGIFVLIATCACSFIDNLFIGRMLGTDALAAVGFFSPISTAAGLSYVIINGAQILCGNYIGAGSWAKVRSLFFSAFLVLGGFFLLFSLGCLFFRAPLAELLGARGETAALLRAYIAGYAPGIAPQALAAMLMSLASYNNELRRSYWGTGVLLLGNALGDWLLTERMGLFGVGLTSSLSSVAALLVLLPGFLSRDKLFHFQKNAGFDIRLVGSALVRGLPTLMFNAGLILKNSLFNYTLSAYTGNDGVAVASVMFAICAVVGAFPGGCSSAFSSLSGLYYGEEDRQSFLALARIALRIGLALCAALILLLILFSPQLSTLFFDPRDSAWHMARRMICLEFCFLIPNLVYNILLKSYQAQGKTLLMNVLSFAEVALVGLFALAAVPVFGADAAWISNAVVDVAMLAVILISVWVWRVRPDLSLPALLKLPDDFGASEQEYVEYTVAGMPDVTAASEQVISFCMDRGFPKQTAFYVGLCVEEMASNVLQYGFGPKGRYSADIRVVAREELTVRIRDNCREFDPRKRIELFYPDAPEKNIGIRIAAKLSKQIDYYNNAGVNTLLMKF